MGKQYENLFASFRPGRRSFLGQVIASSVLDSAYLVCIMVLSSRGPCVDGREVIRRLKQDGWYEAGQSGSHKQFKHPTNSGRVTVVHPKRDIPKGTLKSIEKQAGIKLG